MPRLDSPAVFSALLGGEDAGVWSILPYETPYKVKQRYLRNTNVVQTEFHLENGDKFDVFDFAPRFHDGESYYRAPQLFRIIRAIKGNPRVQMVLRPRFDYGRMEAKVALTSQGLVYRSDAEALYFETDIPLNYVQQSRPFELSGTRYCVLSHGEAWGRPLKFGCEEFYDRTVAYWRMWVKHSNVPFEYRKRSSDPLLP